MSSANHHSSPASGKSSHGSFKSYIVGFILSLVLTVLSFGAVMSGAVPKGLVLPAIVVLCVAQLIVQLVFFLHMGTSPDERDNTAIFLFTMLIIAIVVAGSLWVMHNANVNMMPMHMSAGQAMTRD
ncbi:cytochrome o ubiquinol oxidase subunit IV [Frateuria defendens]|uniref:cytochrome o ubiquinol oxidase subunit IV n=1 Tax=Frateuria defendens TaxID=2219559 RepID=UPI00066FB786|nr:cytochrome o ubiquinol oxidase subunit IV [Frateuria defendens]